MPTKKKLAAARSAMEKARTPEEVFEACRAKVMREMPQVVHGILEQGKQGSLQHARFLIKFVSERGDEAVQPEEDVTETLLKEMQRELAK